ncbi:conserved hypothetical protein [Desulfonatronospira thiodismutans ASO3-1]|uniref:PIN domain-containing protein n=1 Tax=Desulfonatronospira thiodismutans ASO3-1 TaxID=555779 RepID=D6SKR8_9BACT|nr:MULTISPECIES: PIN domain-containing protein [Desulfonatronospira]EFI35279.1 conserved hypothetical protein [Desulfonatronospira thiodismutans ASO3-1]RQD73693.1 MAG: PIN domain-containing protein [Desulfonatronospira sp. MSAO_Bac3]
MKRVFLDANVLFTAAHNPSGKAALLMELAERVYWHLMTSELACEEARRNICIKFPDCLPRIEELCRSIHIVSHVHEMDCPLELPDKDKPIFMAAVQGRASHLLTGDLAHFGPFMNKASETQYIVIQTVSDFFLSFLSE